MAIDFDCIVVGAGVIGIAVAREAALRGLSVLIVERHGVLGSETSSRNSEVVHAGIYYPPGSRKARYCVDGKERLYSFAERHGVPIRKCGKIIVASSPDQIGHLEAIREHAKANGANDLALLDRTRLNRLEPALAGEAGLLSPSTGIIDSHAFMLAMLGEAEAHDAQTVFGTAIKRVEPIPEGWAIWTDEDSDPVARSSFLVNSSGLAAIKFAAAIREYPSPARHTAYYAKGSYFAYSGPVPFDRLVYPVPEPGGLGIHLTLDLQGRARFGPDVEWIDKPDYHVDAGKKPRFLEAIRRYWPQIDPDRLQPDYAGVRPKVSGPCDAPADFIIDEPRAHGLAGLINLFGIESPGLTSALALASDVIGIMLDEARA